MMLDRRTHWREPAWLEDQIDHACDHDDPVVANLKITLLHYELSEALHDSLGEDTGANFHTWATWGSKKAGTTIRRDDLADRPRLGALLSRPLNRASARVLRGNITVLDDIGRATARYVVGGTIPPEGLLGEAFTHYDNAAGAEDRDTCHEQLRVAEDVPAFEHPGVPNSLMEIDDADLAAFLAQRDVDPTTRDGSAAGDWSTIEHRMNYICDLFRHRHFDPGLFACPFDDAQCAEILAGQRPAGTL